MSPAPSAVSVGFVVLPVVVGLLAAAGYARAAGEGDRWRRFVVAAGVVAAWMALTAAVARSGVLLQFSRRPPPLMLLLLATAVASLAVSLSPVGSRLARGVPLAALIALQGFRLPLELLMHRAAQDGVMPVQMSFSGYNFDIVSGTTALLVAGLVAAGRAPRWLVVAWNALGFALVLVIIAIAVASTPLFHAFGTAPERLNTFVGRWPFVWLPTVLVVAAVAGHIVIARKLRRS